MAQKVESSFNFVWRVDRPRSFARRFSEYLSFMLVGPLIMSVAMGFTATLASTTAMTRLREIGVIGDMFDALSWFTPYAADHRAASRSCTCSCRTRACASCRR